MIAIADQTHDELAMTNQDTIGHRIRTLGWRLRTARSGERIANPRAATPATATAAGHPESTEQAFNSS